MQTKHNPRMFFKNALRVLMVTMMLAFSMNFGITPGAAASQTQTPTAAPLNPAFQQYILLQQSGQLPAAAANGHKQGYTPSPWQHPKETAAANLELSAISLPATFDLRATTINGVTSVKDQGSSGSCWSFATFGSLESYLQYKLSDTEDFSENNLKNTSGFDFAANDGGNADMSTAYLARWSGPVAEADDQYVPTSTSSLGNLPVQKHVQEVTFLPKDIQAVKQAVYENGAVYTAFYWNSIYYNTTNAAYYCGSTHTANHAVTIVGWDDTYSRYNFNSAPQADGAFIIKNSWGTGWGQSGYFYISYYDVTNLSEIAAFQSAESANNYDKIYQYDPLGAENYIGYRNRTSAWGANVFSTSSAETLKAVAFYTPVQNSSYSIKIYTSPTSGPTTGTLATTATTTGSITAAGYHTITLNQSVPLAAGQKFSVVLNLTTPSYNYPIAFEYPLAGYSSKATANAGESYISADGTSWGDLTSTTRNANVCLKAFTTNTLVSAQPDLLFTTISAPTTGTIGRSISVTTTVKNGGSATAGAFKIAYYLSVNQSVDTSDRLLGTKAVSSLAAGSSLTATAKLTIPVSALAGNYWIIAVVDKDNAVTESDEANNQMIAGNSIAISKK